jgi:hypothetical protein
MLLERFPTAALPVFIHGTYEAWPSGKRFPRLHPIRVVIGEPQTAKQLQAKGHGQKPHEQIANAMQEEVTKLSRDPF